MESHAYSLDILFRNVGALRAVSCAPWPFRAFISQVKIGLTVKQADPFVVNDSDLASK
jgi:hypothetical protein